MSARFQALPAEPRLFALELEPAIPGYWAGFWSRTSAGGGSLTLADSWTLGGVYLFADLEPADVTAFARLVESLLARIDRVEPLADLRMLWIRDAGAPARAQIGALRTTRDAGGTTRLAADCQLVFRGYAALLGAGCSIAPDEQGAGFVIVPASDQAIAWTTRAGLGRLPADPGSSASLPMTGAHAGTLGFALTLAPASGSRPADLELLDTGLRYFFDAAQDPQVELALDHTLSSLDYPVLDPGGGPIRLDLRFDPVRPLDRDRSHLAFAPEQILLTHFADPLGKPIALRPVIDAGHPRPRLVLALSPSLGPGASAEVLPAGGDVSAYACLDGPFEIVAGSGPHPGPARRVLAGLSGSEYLGFEAASGNRLHFVPDQPAYAGGFRFATAEQSSPDTLTLSDHATTSYVYFEGGAGQRTIYYAQPDDSLLWKTGRPDAFLEFMEVDAGRLPGPVASDGERRGLPLVPYRGVARARAALARELELRVLGRGRRARVSGYTSEQLAAPGSVGKPLATPEGKAVTSLGLLAEFDPQSNVWKSLTLAMPASRSNPLMLAGAEGLTDPDGIKGPLRAALQTHQMFLVVSGGAFTSYASLLNPIVGIEGWQFNLDPEVWAQHGTILIFKFNDKPLVELLADTRGWMHADVFNDDPEATQQRLLALVADARRGGGEDAPETETDAEQADAFAEFNRLVTTPRWQGMLALQVDLPLAGLPPSVAALAPGIDDAAFKAHHLGVTLSPIVYEGGAVPVMEPSAYFGLIAYNDDSEAKEDGEVYGFRVESLLVRFHNSLVVDFRSTVSLRVDELFGELVGPVPLPPTDPPGWPVYDTTLILEGALQRHDGAAAYTLTNREPKRMTMLSDVVQDIVLADVQMKTETAPGTGGGPLHAYFQFCGTLRFLAQGGLDAFGFGSEPGDDAAGGLEFTRMLLHMSAQMPAADESVGRVVPDWRFDVSELVLDVPASRVRPQSLVARFPLELSALIQGEAGSTPASKGFMPVNGPMDQSALTEPWFGLQFALDLGTVGALVSNNSFIADMLVAWSPNARGTSTWLGLRLPGSKGGQKSFTVQGLFDMKMSDVDLFVDDPANPRYTLVFRDIGLEFMGLTLPPVGGVSFVLFGDPAATQKPRSLGWYLAYAKGGVA
jgi:hypothetical protein